MMKPRTRVGLMVGGALALILVGFLYMRRAGQKPPFQFETSKLERGRIVARVTATGTLSALKTVLVGSQVSGRLAVINVDYNSPVEKGQVIAKIDSALFQAAVEQARANYVAAQGNLTKARVQAADAARQFERAKSLRERNLVAQADTDTSQANADAAKAQVAASQGSVEQARAALHSAEVNLNYTTIISPISGTVISRNVDVGQTVAASLQAPTLFTIAEDLKQMQVDTNVAESDVGKLKPQMVATFSVDAYPNERFRGVVRQIRNAPQTVQNVVTYDAVIDVANRDLKLKPGMTANVTFVYAEKDDVLKVANSALRFRPPPEVIQKMMGGRRRQGGASAAPPPGAGAQPGFNPREFGVGPGGMGGMGGMGGIGGPGGGNPSGDRRVLWVLRDRPTPVGVRIGASDGSMTEIVQVMRGQLDEGDRVITEMTGGAESGPPPMGRMPGGMRGL